MNDKFTERLAASSVAYPLLFICSMIAGVGALDGPFFALDDYNSIHRNPFNTGKASILSVFSRPLEGLYAPFHQLLIHVEWSLFGDTPFAFRVVSLLLHFASSVACWWMLNSILPRRRALALGVSLLWAAHPANCESAGWIIEQKTLGCGLFLFLSIATYCRAGERQPSRLLLALGLMFCALLFKAQAVVIGPILVLYELCVAPPQESRLKQLLPTLPFLATGLAFGGITLWVLSALSSDTRFLRPPIPWSPEDALLNLPGAVVIYLRAAFFPWTCSFFYSMERVTGFLSAAMVLNLSFLIGLGAAACYLIPAGSRRLFGFCVLGWLAALGPLLNLSVWSYPAHDRFQYVGLPFILLAGVLLYESILNGLPNISSAARKAVAITTWVVAILFIALLGGSRGALFGSELAVNRDAAAKNPDAAYAHMGMVGCLMREWQQALQDGRHGDQIAIASEIFKSVNRARECWDFKNFFHNSVDMLVGAGDMLQASGKYEEAESLLRPVATDARWAAFKSQRADAIRLLAGIEARKAERVQTPFP